MAPPLHGCSKARNRLVGLATAAAAFAYWRLGCCRPTIPVAAAAEAFSFDASGGATTSFTNDPHQQHQHYRGSRNSCEPSDDPEYPCLVSHPPGAFEGEIAVYLSAGGGFLSVKMVVAGVAAGPGNGGGATPGWASLGFSPDGKMASPSEAVVGFVGLEGGDNPVLRYRMDGYSVSSVTPLPERDQILTDQAVETTADGSLILRFSRPFLAGGAVNRSPHRPEEGSCTEEAVAARASEEGAAGGEWSFPWLDPREDGVFVLWAFSLRGSWPSYHDVAGAFSLPLLSAEGA